MKTRTLREAQHHFSRLVGEVEAGEEIVITRRGKPVVKIVPAAEVANPFDRRVNWVASLKRIDEELGDLPVFEKNIVLEMREDERY